MYTTELGLQERASTGFTHKFVITYDDLDGTAGTTKTLTLWPYRAGKTLITGGAFRLVTPFDGTSTTALALDVGHNGGTTDDPDSILDNYELHNDATEINSGDANGAAFATLRTGYAPQDSGNIEALFTSTTANLTDLTSGEVHIFLGIVELDKF